MKHVSVTVVLQAHLLVNDNVDADTCANNYVGSLIGTEKQYKQAYRADVMNSKVIVTNIREEK